MMSNDEDDDESEQTERQAKPIQGLAVRKRTREEISAEASDPETQRSEKRIPQSDVSGPSIRPSQAIPRDYQTGQEARLHSTNQNPLSYSGEFFLEEPSRF